MKGKGVAKKGTGVSNQLSEKEGNAPAAPAGSIVRRRRPSASQANGTAGPSTRSAAASRAVRGKAARVCRTLLA